MLNAIRVLPGSYQPSWIPCKVWLRSDLGITTATGVSNWVDQSGNSNNATQGTGTKQPTYTSSSASYNNRSLLTFTQAASSALNIASLPLSSPFWIFVIGDASSIGTSTIFAPTSGAFFLYSALGANVKIFDGSTVIIDSTSITSKSLILVQVAGSSTAIYVNATASPTTGTDNGTWTGQVDIGYSTYGLTPGWNGDLAELAAGSGTLTTTQIKQLFAYASNIYNGSWS